ncbi:MAG: DUF3048 domain-containing protein [Bacillota bacterium]|nr:DUF3048 domain-containing protein [Bacillota bacterium]
MSKKIITIALSLIMCVAAVFVLSGCGEEEVVTYTNPLTGKITETEVTTPRPLVVSIDNVNEAIPQSWLSKADIVYEFPVEGEQTRLQAIYYTEFPEEFGPIRSTRPYFVDLTREYKGIFLAHGWSPQARDYLLSDVIPYINAMNSSLDFYRVDDKPAPHNSYIKWETVKAEIEAQGWWDEKKNLKSFKFLAEGAEPAGKRVDKVEFSYDGSDCEFTYDAESNKYVRTIDGEPYIDKETEKSIKVSNVLVQMVKSSELDSKGRLSIDMCAGGDALLFTGGKVLKGTWSREDLDSRTIFVDSEGNKFRMTRGKTWVEVTDQNCDIDYEIIVEEETEEE